MLKINFLAQSLKCHVGNIWDQQGQYNIEDCNLGNVTEPQACYTFQQE